MHVTGLVLHNFRSYETADVALSPGSTAFIGANGQGKTNLVEAIDYVATLGSHRVAGDTPLVRVGTEQAVVRTSVAKGGRTALLEVEINPGRSNRARINKSALPKVRELAGVLRTVVFSPEDLALVKGDPSDRRRFLDALMALRTPRLAGVRSDYERVLKQRNALLKSAGRASRGEVPSTLAVWDEHLCRVGAELLSARLGLLDDLRPYLDAAYAQVASLAAEDRRQARATYKASCELGESQAADDLVDDLARAIVERRRDELDRGVSLVGPHRDDVTLQLTDMPAKGYASHGESWSFALALKLASFELLRADGDDPVLILDDVFAELDRGRREHLAHLVSGAEQVLVTAAVAEDVPAELLGQRFTVADGQVSRDE